MSKRIVESVQNFAEISVTVQDSRYIIERKLRDTRHPRRTPKSSPYPELQQATKKRRLHFWDLAERPANLVFFARALLRD